MKNPAERVSHQDSDHTKPDAQLELGAKDKLVLVYKQALPIEVMERIRDDALRQGIKCAIVSGCEHVFVQRHGGDK